MKIRKKLPKIKIKLYGAISLASVFIIWLLASELNLVSNNFLPHPIHMFKAIVPLQMENALVMNILVSFKKVTFGFILATAVALPLGVLMGSFPVIKSIFNPFLGPLRYLPIAAIIPLFMLWFGLGELMQVMLLFIGIFVYMLPLIIESVENVNQTYIDTVKTLGAKPKHIIFKILVPASLPAIFESIRVMNGIGWTYIMLTEFTKIGNELPGIGFLINKAQGKFNNLNYAFIILFVILLVGVLSDYGLRKINKTFFKWKEKYQ